MKGCSEHRNIVLQWNKKAPVKVEPKQDGNRQQRRAYQRQTQKLKVYLDCSKRSECSKFAKQGDTNAK